MGRAQRRQQQRLIKKRLAPEDYNRMVKNIDYDFINEEVEKRCNFFKELFAECMVEAMQKNGISKGKVNLILDDIHLTMLRKVEEKRGTTQERVSEQ